MSVVESLFSGHRKPGLSQAHAWANSEVAPISLEMVRVIHSLMLSSLAAASTDTRRCRSGLRRRFSLQENPDEAPHRLPRTSLAACLRNA